MNLHGKSTSRSAAGLVGAYRQSQYRVQVGRRWVRLCLDLPARVLERALPRAGRFGLVTAWNPASRAHALRHNRSAQQQLERQLASLGLRTLQACNSGPDGEWRESSRLVAGVGACRLARLAARHGQLAVLWWTRGEPVALRWVSPDGRRLLDAPACVDTAAPGR